VITAAPLTVTAQPDDRGYNGTISANVAPIVSGTLYDPIGTEPTQSYDNKNVGSGKTLTASGLVMNDGNGGHNYVITYMPNTSGVITTAPLTITAVTNTKVYDGTTSAAAIPTVSGLKGTDTVTDLSEVYNTPAVGTSKTLTVATYTVNDGNGGHNYTVTTAANHTGVILAQGATKLVMHTEPSANATAGTPFPTQPVVYVVDQNGNLVTGDNTTQVTASIQAGAGPLLGTTTVTVSGGIATFTNLSDNKAESIILMFTANGLTKTQATRVTVNPAAATRLAIAAPAKATVGQPFTISVTAYDPYNNVATGYRGTVHFASSDSGAWLPANYSFVASDNGAHTFGNSVKLMTGGMKTITVKDINNPSVSGTASVEATRPTPPSGFVRLVAIGGGGSDDLIAGSREQSPSGTRRSVLAIGKRPKAMAATLTSPLRRTAITSHARTLGQADAALDRVITGLKGNLHALVIADRLASARLD